ncbi:hypothetical protein FPQ18DRAFT_395481 [Pyronema domesticum]|nr:hypothetical protein FPQ18DRAFT_395481 [Pyronema domesticum]
MTYLMELARIRNNTELFKTKFWTEYRSVPDNSKDMQYLISTLFEQEAHLWDNDTWSFGQVLSLSLWFSAFLELLYMLIARKRDYVDKSVDTEDLEHEEIGHVSENFTSDTGLLLRQDANDSITILERYSRDTARTVLDVSDTVVKASSESCESSRVSGDRCTCT